MMDEAQLFEVLDARSGPLLRVECQPVYDVASDGDDRLRFDRGDPVPAVDLTHGWPAQLHQDSLNGRPWRKVHILTGEPTRYERFMFEWYFIRNQQAGEEIRILTGEPVARGMPDWYVLADDAVVLVHFTSDGEYVGSSWLDPIAGAPYRALARLSWRQATPFWDAWDNHPEWHRGAAKAA